MPQLSFLVIGEQSLLIQCCERILARGHAIRAVVATSARIVGWCTQARVHHLTSMASLEEARELEPFDVLLSVTNLKMVPNWLLARPTRLAVNFHDGPLPRYAGLNAPVWALANGDTDYGITWHQMSGDADTGAILVQRPVTIGPDDTAFSLNAQCYEAGLAGFHELLAGLETGTVQPRPQDLSARSYFGARARPAAGATLDWHQPATVLQRLVRALDFGPYPNPLLLPKIDLGDRLLLARRATVVPASDAVVPGAVQAIDATTLTIRCGTDALRIDELSTLDGDSLRPMPELSAQGLAIGRQLPALEPDAVATISVTTERLCRDEARWRADLRAATPPEVPFAGAHAAGKPVWRTLEWNPDGNRAAIVATTIALSLARASGRDSVSLAYRTRAAADLPSVVDHYVTTLVPITVSMTETESVTVATARVAAVIDEAERRVGYLADLCARDPELRGVASSAALPVRLVRVPTLERTTAQAFAEGAALTLVIPDVGDCVGIVADGRRFDDAGLDRFLSLVERVRRQVVDGAATSVGALELLSDGDQRQLQQWQSPIRVAGTAATRATVHRQFEAQAARTPQLRACVHGDQSLTYKELNERANVLARHLQSRGVGLGDRVGVMLGRTSNLLVALLAILKAGAAYVPLDPGYPANRLSFMIDDAELRTLITERALASRVRSGDHVLLDEVELAGGPTAAANVDVPVAASDLAYLIYTSGSTGQPKGVMVEHGNVANFFLGMDHCLGTEPGVWLAVTSISFDISVLELFWTLTRGFTVVLHAESRPGTTTAGPVPRLRPIEFGFFYWNVADSRRDHEPDKYLLLIEGAKFADAHGFNAVWTPERHFESFGGLFPNPSVVSAALAMVTSRVALRAGSCVVPLHSPIRIAEEWAVVDNLSNGRVGVSIAAGWAPPDFAIRPEGFANAKQVMFESAELVKRLWRGETVPFAGPTGEVAVRTLPRPLQKELPLWVTTAGNIETFRQAGTVGANLLTHLLGQTVVEVADKVAAYRTAWRDAGHKGHGIVTLMLHTLVGPDAVEVERVVKQPMKDYLKSATFLVKAAAWQFPTFKKLSEGQGKTLDDFFSTISEEDLDALLEFAFQRYFTTSGLFGTVDTCLAMVDRVKAADVDEIACLIDFGIPTPVVLDHLPHLNTLRERAQRPAPAPSDDAALPALLTAHAVTHFQCTPSMAAMLVSDPDARPGLERLQHMLVGGETFPVPLARELTHLLRGRLTNMYGPTETTVWSSVGDVGHRLQDAVFSVSIGRPLPNQAVYVLDGQQRPLPPGLSGELVIGGDGVTRGYWRQSELTKDRFLADPFSDRPGSRMYRTGDLSRFLPDGRLECLGRLDQQVKIRGYRVELGEIEARLREHDGVAEAAVTLREDVAGDQRLVAYVHAATGNAVDAEVLKGWLREQVPEFMVPSVFVPVTALPLTPNGKVDRKALPAPALQKRSASGYRAPAGEMEALISDIWQRALGIESCGTRDNFFDIGGHSLLVVQILQELREKVRRPIQMTDLFKYTTIEALAKFLSGTPDGPDRLVAGAARAEARRAAAGRRARR